MTIKIAAWSLMAIVLLFSPSARGDDPAPASSESKPAATSDLKDAEKAFQELFNNSAMVGHFTIDGKPISESKEERYEITNVAKVEGDDELWGMMARMKYGNKDMSFPIAVPVKFAGSTPMITLDNFVIPGMGTFSARVIFHGDRYAGTWQHGAVGGHMFGKLERLAEPTEKSADEKK